ncbi:MAG: hypothetical protein A2Y97_11410 [Nitrospirae bacterium RBG_13_39_12]|nr:MAG: hypothetical protein A2Y97_11410 [Nitrospirae bacterium RBG_13_39_12]
MNLNEKLCLNYCPFYKPSKNEELACVGFLIVERLIKKGRAVPFEKYSNKLDKAVDERLMQNICPVCSFYKNECDFIQKKEKSSPCGGFILLGHLLKANIFTIENIKEVC